FRRGKKLCEELVAAWIDTRVAKPGVRIECRGEEVRRGMFAELERLPPLALGDEFPTAAQAPRVDLQRGRVGRGRLRASGSDNVIDGRCVLFGASQIEHLQ